VEDNVLTLEGGRRVHAINAKEVTVLLRAENKDHLNLGLFPQNEFDEVRKVVDARITPDNGTLQYKVRWRGRDKKHDAWRNKTDLSCEQLIKEYHERVQRKSLQRFGQGSWEPTRRRLEFFEDTLETEEESLNSNNSTQTPSEADQTEDFQVRSRTRRIVLPVRLSLCCLPVFVDVTLGVMSRL
jgi:hypothetical protein